MSVCPRVPEFSFQTFEWCSGNLDLSFSSCHCHHFIFFSCACMGERNYGSVAGYLLGMWRIPGTIPGHVIRRPCDHGKSLPVWVDNAGIDGPMVWLSIRQHSVFKTAESWICSCPHVTCSRFFIYHILIDAERDAHLACIMFSLSHHHPLAPTEARWWKPGKNVLYQRAFVKNGPHYLTAHFQEPLLKYPPQLSYGLFWQLAYPPSPGHPLIMGMIARAFISKPPAPQLQGAFVFPVLDITIDDIVC